jgi:hypothetical protein
VVLVNPIEIDCEALERLGETRLKSQPLDRRFGGFLARVNTDQFHVFLIVIQHMNMLHHEDIHEPIVLLFDASENAATGGVLSRNAVFQSLSETTQFPDCRYGRSGWIGGYKIQGRLRGLISARSSLHITRALPFSQFKRIAILGSPSAALENETLSTAVHGISVESALAAIPVQARESVYCGAQHGASAQVCVGGELDGNLNLPYTAAQNNT